MLRSTQPALNNRWAVTIPQFRLKVVKDGPLSIDSVELVYDATSGQHVSPPDFFPTGTASGSDKPFLILANDGDQDTQLIWEDWRNVDSVLENKSRFSDGEWLQASALFVLHRGITPAHLRQLRLRVNDDGNSYFDINIDMTPQLGPIPPPIYRLVRHSFVKRADGSIEWEE